MSTYGVAVEYVNPSNSADLVLYYGHRLAEVHPCGGGGGGIRKETGEGVSSKWIVLYYESIYFVMILY